MQRCMNHSPCTCQSKNLQLTYLEQNIKGYRWNEGKEEAYVISEMAVDFPKAYGDGVLISLFLQYLTSRYSPECNCSASLRCMSPRGSLFSGSLHLKDKAQVTKQDDIKLSHVLSRVPSLSLTPAPTSLHLQSYSFCFNNMQFVTFSMSPYFRTRCFPSLNVHFLSLSTDLLWPNLQPSFCLFPHAENGETPLLKYWSHPGQFGTFHMPHSPIWHISSFIL